MPDPDMDTNARLLLEYIETYIPIGNQRDAARDALVAIAERIGRAECEVAYQHDRGDHLVYENEWQAFDDWQRSQGR